MNLAERTKFLTPTLSKRFKQDIEDLKIKGFKIIDLAHGEAEMSLNEESIRINQDMLNRGEYLYSSAKGDTRLLQFLAERNNVNTSNILISAGSKFMSYMIMNILCNPQDDIFLITPNWLTFEAQLQFLDIKLHSFGLDENFRINIEILDEYISKLAHPKGLIISSPNNPTGKVFSKDELKDIYALCLKHDIYFVSDEVFSDFSFEDKFVSALEVAGEPTLKNLIVINSGSKNYGISDLRVGYLVADEEFIKKAEYFHSITVNNIPRTTQILYLNELKDRFSHLEKLKVYESKYFFAKSVIEKTKHLKLEICGGTTVIFPRITSKLTIPVSDFAKKLLTERHVHLIPGDIYDYPQHIRLSYVGDEKEFESGVRIIDEFVGGYIKS